MNAMTTIKTTVRNGRIDVPAPKELPEGTEVVLTIAENDDVMSPEEIARVLAAMRKLEPWDIPAEVAADLDEWERSVGDSSVGRRKLGIAVLKTT